MFYVKLSLWQAFNRSNTHEQPNMTHIPRSLESRKNIHNDSRTMQKFNENEMFIPSSLYRKNKKQKHCIKKWQDKSPYYISFTTWSFVVCVFFFLLSETLWQCLKFTPWPITDADWNGNGESENWIEAKVKWLERLAEKGKNMFTSVFRGCRNSLEN